MTIALDDTILVILCSHMLTFLIRMDLFSCFKSSTQPKPPETELKNMVSITNDGKNPNKTILPAYYLRSVSVPLTPHQQNQLQRPENSSTNGDETTPPPQQEPPPKTYNLIDKVTKQYGQWLISRTRTVLMTIIMGFVVLYALCIASTIELTKFGVLYTDVFGIRGTHNTAVFFEDTAACFFGNPTVVVIDPGVQYWKQETQDTMDQLVSTLTTSQFTTGVVDCWWVPFKQFLMITVNATPSTDERTFMQQLETFLAVPQFAFYYGNDVIIKKNTPKNGTYVYATTQVVFQKQSNHMEDLASDMVRSFITHTKKFNLMFLY